MTESTPARWPEGIMDDPFWRTLTDDLIRDEGLKLFPYDDATGKTIGKGEPLQGKITIGIGHNLTDRGITSDEAKFLLKTDLELIAFDLDRFLPWWRQMPEPWRRGLANMAYNLGIPKLLGFKKMLTALEQGKGDEAAKEALDSTWAREQVGERAERIAALFRQT